MNKEEAWVLGYLLSDGCLNPSSRNPYLSFICQYNDREIMYKVKNILQTSAQVREYPHYKSPQARLAVYDRKDIVIDYNNIKEQIPVANICGYERHFIRGLIDGDGTLSYRESRKSFRLGFVDQVQSITQWVADTICNELMLPLKHARWSQQNNLWELMWEGNVARLIAWWLYHGTVQHCSLQRKLDKYRTVVLNNQSFTDRNDELLQSVNAYYDNNGEIAFITPGNQTLAWCQRLQRLLTFNTAPVFHNKGKRKYYHLYIPATNTQDIN